MQNKKRIKNSPQADRIIIIVAISTIVITGGGIFTYAIYQIFRHL